MGTDGQSCRRTLLADEDAHFAHPERARRSCTRVRDPVPTSEPPRAPSLSRPTAAEHARAVEAIDTLHELRLLRGKATAVEPNVIALALAWRRSDRAMCGLNHQERNVLFGVPARAETHRDWVVDTTSRRLDRLAAYCRHRSLPESERRGTFDIATCLDTPQREPARAARPAPVPGRKRGRPPNSSYTAEELQRKRAARERAEREDAERWREAQRARDAELDAALKAGSHTDMRSARRHRFRAAIRGTRPCHPRLANHGSATAASRVRRSSRRTLCLCPMRVADTRA